MQDTAGLRRPQRESDARSGGQDQKTQTPEPKQSMPVILDTQDIEGVQNAQNVHEMYLVAIRNIENTLRREEQVARWRLKLITPVLEGTHTYEDDEAFFRAMSEQELTMPNGKQVKYSIETFHRYVDRYNEKGLEGLMFYISSTRQTLSDETMQEMQCHLEQFPQVTGRQMYDYLQEKGFNGQHVSQRTIERHMHNMKAQTEARQVVAKLRNMGALDHLDHLESYGSVDLSVLANYTLGRPRNRKALSDQALEEMRQTILEQPDISGRKLFQHLNALGLNSEGACLRTVERNVRKLRARLSGSDYENANAKEHSGWTKARAKSRSLTRSRSRGRSYTKYGPLSGSQSGPWYTRDTGTVVKVISQGMPLPQILSPHWQLMSSTQSGSQIIGVMDVVSHEILSVGEDKLETLQRAIQVCGMPVSLLCLETDLREVEGYCKDNGVHALSTDRKHTDPMLEGRWRRYLREINYKNNKFIHANEHTETFRYHRYHRYTPPETTDTSPKPAPTPEQRDSYQTSYHSYNGHNGYSSHDGYRSYNDYNSSKYSSRKANTSGSYSRRDRERYRSRNKARDRARDNNNSRAGGTSYGNARHSTRNRNTAGWNRASANPS